MTDERLQLTAKLHEQIEDALAAGLTLGQVVQIALNAESSLQADRATAAEDERPDPYPHLGPFEEVEE